MNAIQVFIDGVEYTNATVPFTYSDKLDKELDGAVLQLTKVPKQYFAPTTPVKIVIKSNVENKGVNYSQEKTLYFIVAKDEYKETPVGSGQYRHDLTLIEPTKLLEGIPVETLCFTNAKIQKNDITPAFIIRMTDNFNNWAQVRDAGIIEDVTNFFKTEAWFFPFTIGETLYFPLAEEMIRFARKEAGNYYKFTYTISKYDATKGPEQTTKIETTELLYKRISTQAENENAFRIELIGEGAQESFNFTIITYPFSARYYYSTLPLVPWNIKTAINRVLDLAQPLVYDKASGFVKAPRFKLGKVFKPLYKEVKEVSVHMNSSSQINAENELKFVSVEVLTKGKYEGCEVSIYNDNTCFKITSETMIQERKLLVEITYGEEVDLSKILAPEFSFTQQTLREILQTIGGYIHGEPRLLFNEETGDFDTITFKLFGEQKLAEYYDTNDKKYKPLNEYNYEDLSGSYGIEQACTALNSYMGNLVNKIEDSSSAVGQPFEGGFQSMRTENSNLRYTDTGEVYFPTAYPIKQIHKFSVRVPKSGGYDEYDLTSFLYDERVYNSLSSTDSFLGMSKGFALYYKQDQKGIYGFWFKLNSPLTIIYGNAAIQYAILNILNSVSGSAYNLIDVLFDKDAMKTVLNLSFELTYSPIYSARVNHSKSYIGDWLKYPRVLNYSQGANTVEMEYFGENIKGTVERMGTLEKSYTFTCFNLATIPKAGEMWDEEYYISTVSVEVKNDKFKVTVGLSKSFNRISEYITVSSYKRLYEVSEVMTQERETLYKDYVVITREKADENWISEYKISNDCLFYLNTRGANSLISAFTQSGEIGKISAVYTTLYTKGGTALTENSLPVISSACGNAMEFSWEYKDNYSAGQKRVEKELENETNYYGQEVEYTDYYGRGYYETFTLKTNVSQPNRGETDFPNCEVTGNEVIGLSESSFLLTRKDSREKLKRIYSIEFVTDEKSFIIGSALASNCPLVSGYKQENGQPLKAKLYVFKNRLNKFTRKVDLSKDNILAEFDYESDYEIDMYYTKFPTCSGVTYIGDATGKSWAFVTPERNGKTTQYADEDGIKVTLKNIYGGELLLGCNEDITSGKVVGQFSMIPTHDIQDYLNQRNKN